MYNLILPLGISAYIFLALAAVSGIFLYKYHVKWIRLKWHICLGCIAVLLATFHALIVMIYR